MDFGISYKLEDEQQFWDELEEIVNVQCPNQQSIDTHLRSFLFFVTKYSDEYLQSEYEIAKCAWKLLESPLFLKNQSYLRKRIVGRFIKEAPNSFNLHIMTAILLYDGKANPKTFELMVQQDAVPRLLQLITKGVAQEHYHMHKLLLEVCYEMGGIQRLRLEDLDSVEDEFVKHMLQLIENGTGDPDDPYNYAIIRVLLVLNEQYMISEHTVQGEAPNPTSTNRVLKVLSIYGPDYKSFGENIILLLNRESETSLQLLILKMLFLLFTTNKTYEYFYTNDLCVLVDVIVRNLSDLPDDDVALRHTYLRVLYPLLAHTQLRHPPHYKRFEIVRLLQQLSNMRSQHFSPIDPTTLRLVHRCNKVDWIEDRPTESKTQNLAQKLVGMSLAGAGSSMSVLEVATLRERPGIKTRSKKDENQIESQIEEEPSEKVEKPKKKVPPPPPPSRGSLRRLLWPKMESPIEEVPNVVVTDLSNSKTPVVEVGNGK